MKGLLLSGGLDSSALAWWLRPDICITCDYGQKAAAGEIAAAKGITHELKLRHEIIQVDLRKIGSGLMSDSPTLPEALALEFWPYRNQMLITLAAMKFLPEGLTELAIGAVKSDRHADGRAPFLRAIDKVMSCQKGNVRISAPALRLSPAGLLRKSKFPAALVGLTFSCHVAEYACGQCPGCEKHRDVVASVFNV